jgi:hypothetical protein
MDVSRLKVGQRWGHEHTGPLWEILRVDSGSCLCKNVLTRRTKPVLHSAFNAMELLEGPR